MPPIKSVINRSEILPAVREQQVAQTRTDYYASANKVTRRDCVYYTGINRHSGKRWYRWQTTAADTVKVAKDGHIYGLIKMGNAFIGRVPFATIYRDETFGSLVADYIGEVTPQKVYPLADHWNLIRNSGRAWGNEYMGDIPAGVSPGLRQQDMRAFCEVLFGKTRYRKDLNKACAQSSLETIAFAREFRGFVPIDWVVSFLRNNVDGEVYRVGLGQLRLRDMLPRMDPRSYRNLLGIEMHARDWYALDDIKRISPALRQITPGTRFRNWREVHDHMYDHVPRRPLTVTGKNFKQKNNKVQLNDIGKKINGVRIGAYQIITPKDSNMLLDWGARMRNCIGGYGRDVSYADTQTTLGAVMHGDTMIANFEIQESNLRQFLGKCNQQVDPKIANKFEEFFQSIGVSVDKYWGRPIDNDGNVVPW